MNFIPSFPTHGIDPLWLIVSLIGIGCVIFGAYWFYEVFVRYSNWWNGVDDRDFDESEDSTRWD